MQKNLNTNRTNWEISTMFNCDEYGGNYIDQKYLDERNTWVYESAQKFEQAIKSSLNEDTFSSDISMAMAVYYYNCTAYDSTAFFDAHGLLYSDAVCYLHYITEKYESEMEEAYLEHTEAY